MRKLFLISILLSDYVYCQSPRNIDSLKRIYFKGNTSLELVNLIAQAYETVKIDSSILYANKLLLLSKNNYDYSARAYNTLANCQLLLNNFDTSIFYYNQAIKYASLAKKEFDVAVYNSSIAQAYLNFGESKKAIVCYEKSLSFLNNAKERKKEFYLASIYGGMGDAYNQLSLYDFALEYQQKALNLNLKIGDPISLGINYNGIASLYFHLEQFNQSKIYNQKALGCLEDTKYTIGKAAVKLNMAECYFKLNQLDSSLLLLKKSENDLRSVNSDYNLGNIYQLYGEINLSKRNIQKAISFFINAVDIHNKSSSKYFLGMAYLGLSDCFKSQGKNTLSMKYINRAIIIFEREKNLKEKKLSYEKLFNLLLKSGSYKDLSNCFIQYNKSIEEYYVDKRQKAIAFQEIRFQTQQKQAEILTLQNKNLKEEKIKWILVAILGMSIIGLGIFWKLYRKIKGQKFVIENLQKELHHRIKNNLTIINKFIDDIKNKSDKDNVVIDLTDLQNKIESINIVHKQLYDTSDMTNMNLKSYIDSLAQNVANTFDKKIQINNIVDDKIQIDIERSFPLGLIISEFITNSYKHGFQSTSNPSISIKSSVEKNKLKSLELSDNGVGFNIEMTNKKSLGLRLIHLLSRQMDCQLEMKNDRGTKFTLNFT